MQNQNENENENGEYRKIDRYPRYEINNSGFIRTAKGKKDVAFLKRSSLNGFARVSLEHNGKKHKETVMQLLEETFTAKEIMGEDGYDSSDDSDEYDGRWGATDDEDENIDSESSDEDISDEPTVACGFNDEEIIAMCALYDNAQNVRDTDKEFYLKFSKKNERDRNYSGKMGLETIITYYIDKDGARLEERDKLIKKFHGRLPDWRDKYKPYY